MIARYYFQALMTNKLLWFWGGFFSFMWAILGAFVFYNGSITSINVKYITASYYAIISLVSFSAVSITLATSIAWSSNSLIFSFKFTKLSKRRYLLDLMLAWILVSVFLIVIGILFTSSMFYLSSKVDVFPDYLSFLKTFSVEIFIGLFFMSISVMLVLLVISFSRIKFVQFLSFIPMVLVFGLSYQLLFGSASKILMYLSPWDSAPSLIQAAFLSSSPLNSFVLSNPQRLSWQLLIAGLMLWELTIFVIDIYLFKHIKAQDIEAMRQV